MRARKRIRIGLGSLIAFLEEGQNQDWFTSTFIQHCFELAVVFIPLFLIVEFAGKHPVVNLVLAMKRAYKALQSSIQLSSFVLAFSECFLVVGNVLLAGSLVVWFCKKAKAGAPSGH